MELGLYFLSYALIIVRVVGFKAIFLLPTIHAVLGIFHAAYFHILFLFFTRFLMFLYNKFLLLSYLKLGYTRNIVIVARFLLLLLYDLLGLNALLTSRLLICMRLMSMLFLGVEFFGKCQQCDICKLTFCSLIHFSFNS